MAAYTATFVNKDQSNSSKLSFEKGESLLLLCEKAGISIERACGGKGICGQCKVRFLQGAPLPLPTERQKIAIEELRQGVRLACLCKLTGDCIIEVPNLPQMDVISQGVDVTWETWQDDDSQTSCDTSFLVVDIGTTTVVMEKRSLQTGRVLAVYKDVNAQRKFGADVITRMEASLSDEVQKNELALLIQKQIETGVNALGFEGIQFMVISGNTTMVHLLMGYDVSGLSRAPFSPVTLDEIKTSIAGITTYVMPGFSAFVGGDLWADYMCVQHLEKSLSKTRDAANFDDHGHGKKQGSCSLIIDLGTNAEMILMTPGQDYSTACAAGCAFDQPGAGYFGSDMIALLANLKRNGKIDVHGILDSEDAVLQKMIQDILLAKAAIRTGIEVLAHKAGISMQDISNVYLAGGFGYYLSPQDAGEIGLLPDALVDVAQGMGNMVLPGAALYAKEHLTGQKTEPLGAHMQCINLAMEESFNEIYIGYLNLE